MTATDRAAVGRIRDQAAERLRTSETETSSDPAVIREHAWQVITEAVRDYADGLAFAGQQPITPDSERDIAQAVYDDIYGLGRLQPILDDPGVETVDVNGCDEVWVNYADGTKTQAGPVADSDEQLTEMVRRWGAWQGSTARDFSEARPRMQLALAGKYRLGAVMRITPRPSLSIRCHRMLDADLDLLTANGTLTPEVAAFLKAAVRSRKDIVVTGGMSAGKTTMLRALAGEFGPDERIATVEHDYELFLHKFPDRHRDVLAMQVREANAEGAGAVTMTTCIKDALWMNARRIIVGEVRGEELLPMLEAMNTGGDGSLCTLHADSAGQAFARMLVCAESCGLAIPPASLFRLIGMAVDFIVHLEHRDGRRWVSQVSEVLPPADATEPAVNQVFTPSEQDNHAYPCTAPQCLPDLVAAGYDPAPFTRRAWEQVRSR